MTENFATSLIVRADAIGPQGIIAGPYLVNGSNALLSRTTETSLDRRDLWRSITERVPVMSRHQLGWEFEVGDSDVFELVADALADPGRSTDAAGVRTWRIGRPDDVTRWDFIMDPVEGGHFELLAAACSSAQLVIERGRIASVSTQWQGRSLVTNDSNPEATEADNTQMAGSLSCYVAIGGMIAPVFSGAVSFTREISAAQYNMQNVATRWTGRQVVDVLGRLVCRVPSDNFATMMRGGVIERSITITLDAGSRRRVITIPAARMQILTRGVINAGTYEHVIEFASVRITGQDLATITSSTA